ncbi:alcohol oxidase [Meredithblackwellia eburnea MCA 4105]
MAPPTEVDVIVVGGGAAGAIVAGRLAKADKNLQVAVIEAGINNKDYPTTIQPAMYLSHLAPTSTTANFYAAKESSAVADRTCIVPCGGMLGGGSSINFMMYTRGSASDYDDWNQEGWSFNDLLPLARKMETNHQTEGQDPKIHGNSGPLNVSYGGHQSEIGKQWIKAAQECTDVPFTHDLQNFKTGHGMTNWAKWIDPKSGRRQDTAHCYLHPVAESQTNLHILTEKKTIRVLLDENNRAVGVEYCHNPLATAPLNPEQPPQVSDIQTMKARKMVVVSAGAFGTPLILQRSGIGAKDILEKAGVTSKVDLKGVGAEYQDHQLTLATYRVADDEDTLDDYLRGVPEVHAKVGESWSKEGKGIVASNVIDAGMKARPNEQELAEMGPDFQKVWKEYFENAPDKPVMFGGVVSSFLGDHSLLPPGRYMMLGGYLMYPLSNGSIYIKSANPFDAPDFDAAFLSHPADMDPQVWMYKKLREIGRRMPTYRGEIAAIHPKFSETSAARCVPWTEESSKNIQSIVYSDEDNKAIEQWMRENVGTTWHSMATCPMKARDVGGVVDSKLNVYGTSGLKLADLSICPANVGSNTYSVALTVGEKAAMLVAEELGIAGV